MRSYTLLITALFCFSNSVLGNEQLEKLIKFAHSGGPNPEVSAAEAKLSPLLVTNAKAGKPLQARRLPALAPKPIILATPTFSRLPAGAVQVRSRSVSSSSRRLPAASTGEKPGRRRPSYQPTRRLVSSRPTQCPNCRPLTRPPPAGKFAASPARLGRHHVVKLTDQPDNSRQGRRFKGNAFVMGNNHRGHQDSRVQDFSKELNQRVRQDRRGRSHRLGHNDDHDDDVDDDEDYIRALHDHRQDLLKVLSLQKPYFMRTQPVYNHVPTQQIYVPAQPLHVPVQAHHVPAQPLHVPVKAHHIKPAGSSHFILPGLAQHRQHTQQLEAAQQNLLSLG